MSELIVHSTLSELRIEIGKAIDYYTDQEDASIIWIKERGSDEYVPHTYDSPRLEEIGSQSTQIPSMQGDIQSLKNLVDSLSDQVQELKKTNVVPVDYDGSDSINQPEADLVITTSSEPISTPTTIVGKSVSMNSVEVTDSKVSATANSGDIVIKGMQTSGDLPKSTSNAAVLLNSDEYININSSNFDQTGYNSIEIGYSKLPKGVNIDGLNFNAKLSNNAILIFGQQEGAVINISDCYFKDLSNALRLSNRTNTSAVINIINCKVDKWETATPDYAGFLLLQDYTSGSKEAEIENNLFAKLTINFINLIGPDGKQIKPTDVSEVCYGGSGSQVIYMYNNSEGLVPYSEDRYPKINFL